MNITDLPTNVADLSVDELETITRIGRERNDLTEVPVATSNLSDDLVDHEVELLAEREGTRQLLAVVDELPADITQVDVARFMTTNNRENIRYSPTTEGWLVFDQEKGWTRDFRSYKVHKLVIDTLRHLAVTAPEDLGLVKLKRFTKTRRGRARQMETIGAINSITNLAAEDLSIHCDEDDIDAVPTIVGTPHGMVLLPTGEWMPHSRDLLVTRRVAVDFEPTAKCERWELFLREVLGDDPQVQDYFQQLVGYVLSGETSVQQMWLMVGSGSNGKSTLLQILQKLLSRDYALQGTESVLLGRGNVGGATPDLVRLKGVRCALLTETADGQSFNEERVKALVAADTIAARGLYRDLEEFVPQAKYFLASNHLPKVHGSDKGIWRRLIVVPFEREFEVGANPHLKQELVDELPGIFAWAVRGAVRWYDRNIEFTVPTSWRLATGQYQSDQDPVSGFLSERVDLDSAQLVGATELFNNFVTWCVEEDRPGLSQSEFGRRLMATGRVTKRKYGKANRAHYFGARLCPDVAKATFGRQSLTSVDGHTPTLTSPEVTV